MDYGSVSFWFVFLTSLSGLIVTWTRVRSVGNGWIIVYLAILVVCVTGWFLNREFLILTAAGMWALLVLAPGLIGQVYHRQFLRGNYSGAYRLARIIRCLHPFDGWREQPEFMRAHDLVQKGDLPAAMELLNRFKNINSPIGITAMISLYRITNQWEELLEWYEQHPGAIDQFPQLIQVVLRARGETGDVEGLVELYARRKSQIGKLVPASSRDLCRLMLFTFCGKVQHAERLLSSGLALLPRDIREFWLATAQMAAGERDLARNRLEAMLPSANPLMRSAIERRLSREPLTVPGPLGAETESVIEEAAREQRHDQSFGGGRSLFSRQARATQILIILNVCAFVAEVWLGGGTNLEVLYRMGAMFPAAVRNGEWWRLIASLFLHYGFLHLAMNMTALWLLGPFTEFALGFWRFLAVYLTAGIGSMSLVMMLASGPNHEQLTLGASGCVMGLVGATGALMLRGWLKQKALSAKRRLVAILAIVGTQTVFDLMVPQVSMTAHLSGAVLGFMVVNLLRDRLARLAGEEERAD